MAVVKTFPYSNLIHSLIHALPLMTVTGDRIMCKRTSVRSAGCQVQPRKRVPMETHHIRRVLRARYGGIEASDVLVQFARIELERPDALTWMQNGKFFEIYGDAARLIGRLLDLRVAEKPLMTGRDRQPIMLAMTGITIGSEREHLARLLRMGYRIAIGREVEGEREGSVKARQLAEVITPGTVFDEDLLDDERRLL